MPRPGTTLREVLGEAQAVGFLGPGDIEQHIKHAEGLATLIAPLRNCFLDLGSGGGLPGLVLSLAWPDAEATLLDAQERRCQFLRRATETLGIPDRATVVCGRAEQVARSPQYRGKFPLVVARSFGSPAVTAECAVGFLASGGALVVTEPPPGATDGAERWPAAGLAELGLSPAEFRRSETTGVVVVRVAAPPSDRWPRRPGIPEKRPLW